MAMVDYALTFCTTIEKKKQTHATSDGVKKKILAVSLTRLMCKNLKKEIYINTKVGVNDDEATLTDSHNKKTSNGC